ncbi:hypothetical protein CBS147326_9425 [Penicillium roqueforti]|nr:hypothetical protein CBS147326_9425 [Penicillium roqueforti]
MVRGAHPDLLLMHPSLSQKALILSRVLDCLTSTNNHFHTFAYLPQRSLPTTPHMNDSYNMPTYTDILFEMSIAEQTAASFPVLLQRFQHALYQHNVKREGSTILCWAAGQGCVSRMETLLDKYHADVNTVHEDNTPLIKAVMSGSLAAVERVLSRTQPKKNPAIAQTGNRHKHSVAGQERETPDYLQQGGHPQSDEEGRTPLWWAAYDGDQLLVRSILDDPRTERHRRDNRGRAPVDAAKFGNEYEIVCLLTNCRHHCPANICAAVVLIVILIPILLLLSLASVVGRALARICIL